MADRNGRIKAVIARNISDILMFELKNSHIGMPSVNEVIVANDYSFAKVYVSFLGSKNPQENLQALNKCKGFIRSSLAKKLDIRKTPEITFVLDDSYEKAEHLEELIKKGL
jgi:ribosome-binding factor A